MAAVSDWASSGHLRRCSDADTIKQMLEPCKRCFYTIMANYNGSLQAVDCHIHSVRYDMVSTEFRAWAAVSDWASSGHLRRCSDADTIKQMLEPCKRCFYTIMANYNGSLQAVDCHIHSVRYDMAVYRV